MNAGDSTICFVDSKYLALTLQYLVKLRDRYLFSFWDSLIVASAVLGQANILYSEDMQDGLIIENSLRIVNPFLEGKT